MPSTSYEEEPLKVDTGELDERKYANGRIVYRSRIVMRNGKKKLQTFDFNGKQARTQAKDAHRARLDALKNSTATGTDMTLVQARDLAWAHYQQLIDLGGANGKKPPIGQDALNGHKQAWKDYVTPFVLEDGRALDDVTLDEFTQDVAEEWLLWLAGQKIAPSTQNSKLSAVRNTLKFCRHNTKIKMKHDPFHDIPDHLRPDQGTRPGWEGKTFTKQELGWVCEAALSKKFADASLDNRGAKRAPAQLGEAVISYRWTGMRLSELAGQHWYDVDLDEGVMWVSAQRDWDGDDGSTRGLKWGNEKRLVGMAPELLASYKRQKAAERLKRRGAPSDLVYTDITGQPVSENQLKLAVRRACRLAGLGDHGPQTLRRSFGTLLAPYADRGKGGAIMGHSPEVNDKSYVKPARDIAEAKRLAKQIAS